MIHRIRIQNFKSLRDVTVDLSPVTVLVGKSGTGKTNFVEAVRFLRDVLAGRRHSSHDRGVIHCTTNPDGELAFEIEFEILGFDEHFRYSLQLRKNLNVAREWLCNGPQMLFHQHWYKNQICWVEEPALVSPPKPGGIAISRLPGLERVVMAFTALTTGIGVYSFPLDVLTNGQPSQDGSGLNDRASNYLTVLKDISSSLHDLTSRKGIAAALRQVNATVESVELDSIQAPKTAYVGHKLGEKTLPLELRHESDGFRRFYAHLLALYQTPPKQTLLFEEPENGIYIGALSLLADEFKAAPDAGRGQVILTTHSPALLDHFSAEEIRVVELVDLETQIGPIALEQKAALAEQLLYPGELLTADPARLETIAE